MLNSLNCSSRVFVLTVSATNYVNLYIQNYYEFSQAIQVYKSLVWW